MFGIVKFLILGSVTLIDGIVMSISSESGMFAATEVEKTSLPNLDAILSFCLILIKLN